jgi:hypothetical protein
VDSLSTRDSKRNVDIGSLMDANAFPALPLAGFDRPTVSDLAQYDNMQDFLDGTFEPSDPERPVWQQALAVGGFVSFESIEFSNAGSSYGAVVLRFTSRAGARQFNKTTLLETCSLGELQSAHVMPALSGGLNYILGVSGEPPFRASFVAGDTVVRLHICHCVQAPDDQVLAGQWAQAVASAVGAA